MHNALCLAITQSCTMTIIDSVNERHQSGDEDYEACKHRKKCQGLGMVIGMSQLAQNKSN